ncbi:AzlD domain-containing protein [Gibbsiella greigii]
MNEPILFTVIACAVITIAVRALPIVFLASATLPRFMLSWLSFVPSGIMVGIVILELVGKTDQEGGIIAPVVSALVTTIVAVSTKSLFTTVFVGVGFYLIWFTF